MHLPDKMAIWRKASDPADPAGGSGGTRGGSKADGLWRKAEGWEAGAGGCI